MPAHTPIPDIPGQELLDPQILAFLSSRLSDLCNLNSRTSKFPGSQPVSFTMDSLKMLEDMDFWVCEKSDGVRVLVFVIMNGMTGEQEVWLVSRVFKVFEGANGEPCDRLIGNKGSSEWITCTSHITIRQMRLLRRRS
jgi:mRNA guanylyltransferase